MTITPAKLRDYARNGLTRMLFPTPFRDPLYFEAKPGLGALTRSLVWWLPPTRLKSRYLALKASCRVVEIPFALNRLRADPGARVLDFGCATSRTALELASLGYHVTGVDFRPYPAAHPNLESRVGDFLGMSFTPGTFDAVVAVSSVEHCGVAAYGSDEVSDGDIRAMERFHALLKPGGQLLLTVPYGRAGRNEYQRVYDAVSLARLLDGFAIEEASYYSGLGRRDWKPVPPEALAEVESVVETQGVACVAARRA